MTSIEQYQRIFLETDKDKPERHIIINKLWIIWLFVTLKVQYIIYLWHYVCHSTLLRKGWAQGNTDALNTALTEAGFMTRQDIFHIDCQETEILLRTNQMNIDQKTTEYSHPVYVMDKEACSHLNDSLLFRTDVKKKRAITLSDQ